MIVSLRHTVEVGSVQKATALREKVSALLEDDPDVTVLATDQAQETRTFTVHAVDVKTREVIEERVEATTAEEAEEKVAGKDVVVARVDTAGPAGAA